jgi:integrase
MWREQHASAPLDVLIFPTEKGTPQRPENWLRRNVKPIAKDLGITVPVNFQVLRRSFVTNAQDHGNLKDVQTHLRHANPGTTAEIYTQPIDANVRRLVNAVAEDVMSSKPDPESIPEQIQ